jgi:hypothetical protein
VKEGPCSWEVALESKAEGRGDALALCQAQCQVRAQPLPLASPPQPPNTHTSARTSPPSYPRPCAKKYFLQPSVVYILEAPSCPPKTFAPPRHRTRSFLPMSSPTPSSKTGLWDVPPSPLQGAELCHPLDRHPPPKPPPFLLSARSSTAATSGSGTVALTVPSWTPPSPLARGKGGGGGARGSGAHRLQRRDTHQAAAAAATPAPEPARGRGGGHRGRKEPREREDPRGAGSEPRGGARRHAPQAPDGPRRSAGRRARHPQGGGARRGVGGPPPSWTLTRKWCCGSCSREPRVLHAHSPPTPPNSFNVQSFLGEGGRAGNENGGGEESSGGRAAAGKERGGKQVRVRVTSESRSSTSGAVRARTS